MNSIKEALADTKYPTDTVDTREHKIPTNI